MSRSESKKQKKKTPTKNVGGLFLLNLLQNKTKRDMEKSTFTHFAARTSICAQNESHLCSYECNVTHSFHLFTALKRRSLHKYKQFRKIGFDLTAHG